MAQEELDSRPPPPLESGEAIVRTYASDFDTVHGIYRVLYRRFAILVTVLFAVGIVLQLPLPIHGVDAPALGFCFLAGFVLVAGLAFYYRSRERQLETHPLPDRVYLTSKRVILDKGTSWRDVSSLPLLIVGEVTLWQSKEMLRVGTAWVYVAPIGARSLEVTEDGERIVAPGVLEVQYLSQPDATRFRGDLLSMAQRASRSGSRSTPQ